MSDDFTIHDSVHAFADGELPPEEADAFRLHLGTCEQCQLELADILQMQNLGGRLAAEEASAAPVPRVPLAAHEAPAALPSPHGGPVAPAAPVPQAAPPSRAFRPTWSRRRRALGAVLGGALAAALAFMVLRQPLEGDGGEMALALGPTRSLEARLSYGNARDYRPYGVTRSGTERPAEKVPLKTLAKLEDKGDLHGLAVASLLSGEREQAGDYLRRASASPDVDADKAAVLLSQGKLEESLALLDGVLAKQPKHPQALWNRGLVLRELGFDRLAAWSFGQVAALNEPGWSTEARERQQSLEAQFQERLQHWRAAQDAGLALVNAGTPVPEEVARHAPSIVRPSFYEAAATATSAQALRVLLPLARELDAASGGDVLQRYVERTAQHDFTRRAPLAATLKTLLSGPVDRARDEALLKQAQAAGEPDILLVALERSGSFSLSDKPKEYAEAAAALGDPWFQLRPVLQQADDAFKAQDTARAGSILQGALTTCQQQRMDARCLEAHTRLATLAFLQHQPEEAFAQLRQALGLARQMNDLHEEDEVLRQLGFFARDSALGRAATDEVSLHRENPKGQLPSEPAARDSAAP